MTQGLPPQPPSTPDPSASRISEIANGLVIWIARHWLALFNTGWGTYVVLPFLAPILLQAGYTAPAQLIYTVYSFTCHQLPDHSYFLFGPDSTPLAPALEAAGAPPERDLFGFRGFIGNLATGYKVALCQRDLAIYGSVVLAGLLFALVRTRLRIPAPSLKVYALFLLPIALDGGSALIGLRDSNWWLRTVTGMIFGVASVWLAYPYVDDAMVEVIEVETARAPRSPAA
jgi:uncharacterized membrane protein